MGLAGRVALLSAGAALGAGVAAASGDVFRTAVSGLTLAVLLGGVELARRYRAVQPSRAELMAAADDASPDGRLIVDPDGRAVHANSRFRDLFVFDESAPLTALAAQIYRGGDPDGEAEEDFARLRAGARAGASGHAEMPFRDGPGAGGEPLWRRLSVHPLPGWPGYTLWCAQDVTARRELELARRAAETALADLFDILPVGVFATGDDGRFLFVNRCLADWLERTPQEMLGDLAFDDVMTVPAEAAVDPGEPRPVSLRTASGRRIEGQLVVTDIDGDWQHGTRRGGVVLLDAGARRDGRQAMLSLEHRLRWLFDHAPVGIVLVGLDGSVTDCNPAFLRLVRRTRGQVTGEPLTKCLGREDAEDVAGQLSKVVMGTSPAAHMEVRLRGDRQRAASLYATPMTAPAGDGEAGEVTGLILHFIDATEHKHLEVQFAQAQKMQAMGQLAGGVAHDFNNLLTAMIGFCDLLLMRHSAGDPSFSDIMQIKQNANRAANLVRQLLAFSRRQTLQPRLLNITDSLAELSHLLRRLLGERIELRLVHGRDIGLVRVDPGQFDQVIINLAVNARDAMHDGGTLTIRTGTAELTEPEQRGHEVMPAGRYVLIEIADTGVGIARENLGRIFEPFFSTKEVGEGTGLGLSTVYGIVRQTGGFIFVDSAPGQGATFSIYLPHYEAERAPDASAPPPKAKSDSMAEPSQVALSGGRSADLTGAGTILLVEDEDAVRVFSARALRNKGYTVLEATNGEAALEILRTTPEKVDVLISDVVMPGMDGAALVERVREEHPGIRVILISGYSEDVFRSQLENAPRAHFLAKPFSLKQLAAKVKEVLAEP